MFKRALILLAALTVAPSSWAGCAEQSIDPHMLTSADWHYFVRHAYEGTPQIQTCVIYGLYRNQMIMEYSQGGASYNADAANWPYSGVLLTGKPSPTPIGGTPAPSPVTAPPVDFGKPAPVLLTTCAYQSIDPHDMTPADWHYFVRHYFDGTPPLHTCVQYGEFTNQRINEYAVGGIYYIADAANWPYSGVLVGGPASADRPPGVATPVTIPPELLAARDQALARQSELQSRGGGDDSYGCRVALCTALGIWYWNVSECVETLNRLTWDLRKHGPGWPKCNMI